jgi:hypothetical protein
MKAPGARAWLVEATTPPTFGRSDDTLDEAARCRTPSKVA